MTVEMEIEEALQESFRAALVLTGGVEAAERAVTNAIATLGPDCSAEALLAETARSAFEHDTFSGELSSILPVELQALFLLSPIHRYCFVLRVLIGLDLRICSNILRSSLDEVQETLCRSLLDLPQALEAVRCMGGVTSSTTG
jgi:DNA-directed RNA polymerase specialized sigma24 family protein